MMTTRHQHEGQDWLPEEIWKLTRHENLNGMNRIYTGSGDYGMMSIYADGFIDNVGLLNQ
jgi:hypothetical protein